MASNLIMASRWRNNGNSETLFSWALKCGGDCSHEIKIYLFLERKAMTNIDGILKSRDLANKSLYNQSYSFSSSHVWM